MDYIYLKKNIKIKHEKCIKIIKQRVPKATIRQDFWIAGKLEIYSSKQNLY